jgi:hypothetical protein
MQIIFEFDTPHGKFADALYFEDNDVPDEFVIESLKQKRLSNWIAALTAPPPSKYIEIDGVKYEKIVIDGQAILKPVRA